LACDKLKYKNWKSFYGQLKTNCPEVTIGASNNKIGNLRLGEVIMVKKKLKNKSNTYSIIFNYLGFILTDSRAIAS